MCAILQLVSAPLNPIPIAEHFRRSHHRVCLFFSYPVTVPCENILYLFRINLSILRRYVGYEGGNMQRHDYHPAPAYMRFQSVKVGIIRLGPVARSTR